MVVSMIGYKMDKVNINLLVSDHLKMDFQLIPEPIEMKEIRVSAKANTKEYKQWKKDYKLFKRQFLGTSINGESCKILNEYVLSFKKNDITFTAEAIQPLEIENLRLGYLITYYLDEFQINRTHTKYAGESFFVEMEPKSERQESQWKTNRRKAYFGSLRHFLATLGKRFDVRFEKIANEYNEKEDWKFTTGRYGDPLVDEGFDVFFPKKYTKGFMTTTDFKLLQKDTLITATEIESELRLSFAGKLMVVYNKESEENNYALDRRKGTRSVQTSFLILDSGSVVFDKKGRYFEMFMIEQQGYSAWERVGERLPLQYDPYY